MTLQFLLFSGVGLLLLLLLSWYSGYATDIWGRTDNDYDWREPQLVGWLDWLGMVLSQVFMELSIQEGRLLPGNIYMGPFAVAVLLHKQLPFLQDILPCSHRLLSRHFLSPV